MLVVMEIILFNDVNQNMESKNNINFNTNLETNACISNI